MSNKPKKNVAFEKAGHSKVTQNPAKTGKMNKTKESSEEPIISFVAQNDETNRTLKKNPSSQVAPAKIGKMKKTKVLFEEPIISFAGVDFVTEFLNLYVKGKEMEFGKTDKKIKDNEVAIEHELYTEFLNLLYEKAFGPVEVVTAASSGKKHNKATSKVYAPSKGAIVDANQYLLYKKLLYKKQLTKQSEACGNTGKLNEINVTPLGIQKIRSKEVLLDEEQEALLLEANTKMKTGSYSDDLIESIKIFRRQQKTNAKVNAKVETVLKLPEAQNNESTKNSASDLDSCVAWSKDESDEKLMLMYATELGHKPRYMPDLDELVTPSPDKQRILITTLASTMYTHDESMAVALQQKKLKRLCFNVPAHRFPTNAPLHLITFLPAQFLPPEFIAGGVFASNELTREYYPYGILGANMKRGPTPAIFVGLRFNKIVMQPEPVVEALSEHDVTIGISMINSQLMQTACDLLRAYLMQDPPKTNLYVPSLHNFEIGVDRLSKMVLTPIPQFLYLHSEDATYAAMHEDVPSFTLPHDMFSDVKMLQRPVFLPLRYLPAGFEAGCIFTPNTVTVAWYQQHVENVPMRATPAFFLGRWLKWHDITLVKDKKQNILAWKNVGIGPIKMDLAANGYIPVNQVITHWKNERPTEQPTDQESFTWVLLQQMLEAMHPVNKDSFIFHSLCALFVHRLNAILSKGVDVDKDVSLHKVLHEVLVVGRRLYGTDTLGMHHFTRVHQLLLKDLPQQASLCSKNLHCKSAASTSKRSTAQQPLQRIAKELIYLNSNLAIFNQLCDKGLSNAYSNENPIYDPVRALGEYLPATIIEGQKLYGKSSVAVKLFNTYFKNVDFSKKLNNVPDVSEKIICQLQRLVMIETINFMSG